MGLVQAFEQGRISLGIIQFGDALGQQSVFGSIQSGRSCVLGASCLLCILPVRFQLLSANGVTHVPSLA